MEPVEKDLVIILRRLMHGKMMLLFSRVAGGVLAVTLSLPTMVSAEPTHLMVRAQSLDAKFMGTHTGGVAVTVTDVRLGKVLASGMITGETGDTPRIMQTAHARGHAISDAETAGYDAVIDIEAPTLVRVDARGPMGAPAAAITVSSSLWMLPGRNVLGDGLVLTFPGLIVTPATTRNPDGTLRIDAKVTMMCGCPITPGGIWDADSYSVTGYMLDHGRVVATAPMHYAGQPSQFTSGDLKVSGDHLSVRLVASSKLTPNVGVVEADIDQ
jgi:hypothetical protein